MTQLDPRPSKETFRFESLLKKESGFDDRMVRNATWGAIALTVAGLLFVIVGFAIAEINSWKDYFLLGAPAMLFLLGLTSIYLLRRGMIRLGTGLIFLSNLIVPLVETFFQKNVAPVIFAYTLVSSVLLIWRTLPRTSRRWASISGGIALLSIIVLEAINFPFRINPADELVAFVALATAILTISFIIQAVRETWGINIRNRLIAIVTGSAVIPLLLVSLILGFTTYYQVRNSLTTEAFNKLAAVQTIKANQIETYLQERQNDMVALSDVMGSVLGEAEAKMEAINILKHDQIVRLFQTWDADVRDVASDPSVISGMRDLTSGMENTGSSQVRALYLGQGELTIAQDGSLYSNAHYQQHGFFSGYIAIHGYEDALLIDPAGNVVYTVHKTDAFGTNLLTGAHKESNLAKLYQNLLLKQAGTTYIADVAAFEGENAMFIGTPIYDGSTFVGVLAYKLPLNLINTVVTEKTGQGKTGETYLIAREDDGRITYRSNRSTAGEGKFVIGYDLTDIATPFMKSALDGVTGSGLIISSTGEAVLNGYQPLNIEGLNWAVLSRVAAEEALSPTQVSSKKDFLTTYKENYGYYDLFLIEPNGFVFYTVAHEAEYRTNILTGEFKDTNLGGMVAEILSSKSFEFVDFAPYAPSNGEPAAFFGIPVLDNQNNVQMIVAVQASGEELGTIMAETTGLGESGETYIIGQDLTRRTETRFLSDLGTTSTILNPEFKVDTVASVSVTSGKSGQDTYIDARGIPVMAVWSPITLFEAENSNPEALLWGVIAKIDVSEALASVNQLAGAIGLVIGLAVLIISVIAGALGTRLATRFVTPILTLSDTAAQIAAGNMDVQVKVESADEIGTLSTAFNTMTSQMRDLIGSLEQRVAARTKDLATVAEVGSATATILESKRLLQEVVDLTKERFNLYHSHIYLLDEKGENLVLTAGAGEPGRIMVSEGRTIPLSREQSLVARAARERKGVTVNDVTLDPNFLPNPLLPETRSELAVPMIVGGNVIGVFDIQSEQIGRFTESDVNIQTTLAAQLATSIQNVRSFEQSRKQAELESMVNTIGQRIQRSTSIEETMQTAIRELGTALGASRVKAKLSRREDSDLIGSN